MEHREGEPGGEAGSGALEARIFSCLPNRVCAVDAAGRFTRLNPVAESLLGRSAAELVGRDTHATLHYHPGPGKAGCAGDCSLSGGLAADETFRAEDVFACKDGSEIPVSCAFSPLVVGGRAEGDRADFLGGCRARQR